MKTKETNRVVCHHLFLLFCCQKKLKILFSTNSILYLPTPMPAASSALMKHAFRVCVCVCRFAVVGERVREHPRLSSILTQDYVLPFLISLCWMEDLMNLIFSFQFQVDYVLVVSGSSEMMMHLLPLLLAFAIAMATDDGIYIFNLLSRFNEKNNGNRSAKLKTCQSVELLVSCFIYIGLSFSLVNLKFKAWGEELHGETEAQLRYCRWKR